MFISVTEGWMVFQFAGSSHAGPEAAGACAYAERPAKIDAATAAAAACNLGMTRSSELEDTIVVHECHPHDGALLALGGREVAVAGAGDDVLFDGNVGCIERGLQLVGLRGVVGAVVV